MDKETTQNFVEKIQLQQKKEEGNKERQGRGRPSKKLPNKQH